MGAENVSPAERLEQGARVGTENQLAPGWGVEEGQLKHDPKRRVGGATEAEAEGEPAPAPPAPAGR